MIFFRCKLFFHFEKKGKLVYSIVVKKEQKGNWNMFNVDETIKFLQKGCAENSSVDAMEAKVKKVNAENRYLNIKLGLDPTAPDIHLGHAVVLRKIRQLQNLGHHATIIIGDYTGMIGDPSGKSKTRKQLTREEVLQNARTYQEQIYKIIDPTKTSLRFNSEWFEKLSFKDTIKLCSKVTVARMLERDDFANRFKKEEPISIHEFLYPLMQAYDSVAIKADVELGGTDQTFNILMGRNLQKDYDQDPQIALFMPILEGIDGVDKMSKSLGNYIGINEDAKSMYEKVMKIPDHLIIKYFELTTDVHPDDIKKIDERLKAGANPRDIKMELARTIVQLYHGADAAQDAESYFVSIYQKQVAPQDVPVVKLERSMINDNDEINLVELLFPSGAFASKSELRRLIQSGALKINGEKFSNLTHPFASQMILQVGKGKMFKMDNKENKLF